MFEQAFSKYREIWMKNVRTQEQRQIARADDPRLLNATVSQDGLRLAYSVGPTCPSIPFARRRGVRCLWGQRIDPATGRLNGAP